MTHPSCPECSTEYVKRVHRESLKERLLSLFYVYPFRCQLDGHRFRFLQWKVKYVRVEEDRRTYERLPMNFPVTFTSRGTESEGRIADISIAGCALETEAKLVLGAILCVSLQITDDIPPVEVSAAVVRDIHQKWVGIEFLQLKKTERDRLRDFIHAALVERHRGDPAVAGLEPERKRAIRGQSLQTA